jgi:hypothetical protein
MLLTQQMSVCLTLSLLSAKCHLNLYSLGRTSAVTFRLCRAIAQVFSRRVLTADFGFCTRTLHVGFVVDEV